MAIATYEGNEPYIFFSYAHKDSDVVVPIIEALANNGFRVWYDAGIKAGVDYTEDIANRIKNSAVVIVFVSKASIQSEFCHNEIKYAVSKKKKMLLIYIEDVELTPGLEMMLGFTQALFYNRVPHEAFLKNLMETDVLASCWSVSRLAVSVQKLTPSPLSDFEIEDEVLKKYVGKSSIVVIPDSVTIIGEKAFSQHVKLTSVKLPGSVISIGDNAFEGCWSLTDITLPDGVTNIGNGAFAGCWALKNVLIPGSVTSIGVSPFSACAGLVGVTVDTNNPVYHSAGNCVIETATGILIAGCQTSVIPSDVTAIGKQAFGGCRNLVSIEIPDGVTSIGDDAFWGCWSLTDIRLPNSVMSIGLAPFYDCSSLTSITVSVNNPVYHSEGNCIIETATGGLIVGCRRSVIPNGVIAIGKEAFYGCEGLTRITIPESVMRIDDDAFGKCQDLTDIIIPGSVTCIGANAFASCNSLTTITIPDSVTTIGKDAFQHCDGLTIRCQVTSKPEKWDNDWNRHSNSWGWGDDDAHPVIWGWKE